MDSITEYRTLATLANVHELVCRVLEETGGNDFALVSPEEMAQDVAACINHCATRGKGVSV